MYTLEQANDFLAPKIQLYEDDNGCWISVKPLVNMPNYRPFYDLPIFPLHRWLQWQAGKTPQPGTYDAVGLRYYRDLAICTNGKCCNPNHFKLQEAKPSMFPRRGKTKGLSYEEREMIRIDEARGFTANELSEKYDRAPSTIRQICLYLGVYAKDDPRNEL